MDSRSFRHETRLSTGIGRSWDRVIFANRQTMDQTSRNGIDAVRHILQAECGFDPDRHSRQSLERALQRRMEDLFITCFDDYRALLGSAKEAGDELSNLVDLFTVGETSFFRYQAHDDAFVRIILPELRERKRSSRCLNIWSAGCATGEEPYTIALLIREHFPELQQWDINILATDINNRYLRRAGHGRFPVRSLRSTPENYLHKYFRYDNGSYKLDEQTLSMVTFQQMNLTSRHSTATQSAAGPFDIISCRNVMIYFDEDATRKTLDRLIGCLDSGGYMLFGHTEMMQHVTDRLESCRHQGAYFYRLNALEKKARERLAG